MIEMGSLFFCPILNRARLECTDHVRVDIKAYERTVYVPRVRRLIEDVKDRPSAGCGWDSMLGHQKRGMFQAVMP